jgi:Rrf2 family protein
MKLSTKGRYGTRALLDVALHLGKNPVPIKDIAKRQEISAQYLGHLIVPLISVGIIKSIRGAGGGITLAKSPAEIRLSEVIQVLEGSVVPAECVIDPGSCPRSDLCATRDIWDELKKSIDGVLESTTLQDLVERQKRKEQPAREMYHI